MPTKGEKDHLTGVETTGHEWDGIKELNNPLPKWWLYVFYVTILFSIVYWVLYPAWPTLNSYTKGVLGWSQRTALEEQMQRARAAQAVYLERIAQADLAEIKSDPELLNFAMAGGRVAFADNCAPCHGAGGQGGSGYPILADDDWLWGGTLEDIHLTIRHGVRWTADDETRFSEMPRFGADGLMSPEEIADTAEYVLSLSGQASDPAAAERGRELYEVNCAACHGADGEGMTDLGAPALNDAIWIYGGTKPAIMAQIHAPKHGQMPSWSGRLDENTIKQLTIYVHALGGGQ